MSSLYGFQFDLSMIASSTMTKRLTAQVVAVACIPCVEHLCNNALEDAWILDDSHQDCSQTKTSINLGCYNASSHHAYAICALAHHIHLGHPMPIHGPWNPAQSLPFISHAQKPDLGDSDHGCRFLMIPASRFTMGLPSLDEYFESYGIFSKETPEWCRLGTYSLNNTARNVVSIFMVTEAMQPLEIWWDYGT